MEWVPRLLSDHHIPYVTEGPHTTEGWVNIHCPFCHGPKNFHLGINTTGGGCHCWRCGAHTLSDTLSATLGIGNGPARALIVKYKGRGVSTRTRAPERIVAATLKLPKPNAPLAGRYRRYVAERGFDPEQLEAEWGLRQTGPVSMMDGISYSHRILIPIRWSGRLVSFQTRDITNTSDRKYLACPNARELIPHKTILYGDQAHWTTTDTMIVVEGVTDVWRLGHCAAATFGIEYRLEQMLQMVRHAHRFFIVYDNEPHAQEQARRLAVQLRALAKQAVVVPPPGTDPGAMSQDDADHFVRQLIG